MKKKQNGRRTRQSVTRVVIVIIVEIVIQNFIGLSEKAQSQWPGLRSTQVPR